MEDNVTDSNPISVMEKTGICLEFEESPVDLHGIKGCKALDIPASVPVAHPGVERLDTPVVQGNMTRWLPHLPPQGNDLIITR